jgi:DME family drug/metabolite transporter
MKNLLRDTKPETVAALVFCCGAVFLLPLLLSSNLSWVLSPVGMIVVIHLGLLATSLSYYLFCRGLERVQASTAVTLSLAEPLTATLLGIFLVGERLTIFGVAGLALLLGGLVIIAWPSTSRRMPGGNI